MTIHHSPPQIAHRRVGPVVAGEPLVVWRTWVVRPQRLPGGSSVPLLAGLFGFPWYEHELDARCTVREPTPDVLRPWRRAERHHPVVPDPDCTCGIYAQRETLETAVDGLVPAGQPTVTGFVELSGRTLVDGEVFRAQHARIIGPLTFGAPRRSVVGRWADQLARRSSRPLRVVEERNRYVVVWNRGIAGLPIATWRNDVAVALRQRYGVKVEVLSG